MRLLYQLYILRILWLRKLVEEEEVAAEEEPELITKAKDSDKTEKETE
jgi:hypothetical protein